MTVDANFAKKHENHKWEDQSKHASRFVYYNFYDVRINAASLYYLYSSQRTQLTGIIFEYVRKQPTNISMRKSSWNSCGEPAIHNLEFKLVKDHDLFVDARINFKHCGNADGIDGNGRPYVGSFSLLDNDFQSGLYRILTCIIFEEQITS